MPFPYPRVAFTKQGDPAECINKASPRCLQIADLLAHSWDSMKRAAAPAVRAWSRPGTGCGNKTVSR